MKNYRRSYKKAQELLVRAGIGKRTANRLKRKVFCFSMRETKGGL